MPDATIPSSVNISTPSTVSSGPVSGLGGSLGAKDPELALGTSVADALRDATSIAQQATGAPVPAPDMPKDVDPKTVAVCNAETQKLGTVVQQHMNVDADTTAEIQENPAPLPREPGSHKIAKNITGIGSAEMQAVPMSEGVAKICAQFDSLHVARARLDDRSAADLATLQEQVQQLREAVPHGEEGSVVLIQWLDMAEENLGLHLNSARELENHLDSLKKGWEGCAKQERKDYLYEEWPALLEQLGLAVEGSQNLSRAIDNLSLGEGYPEAYLQALEASREHGIFFEGHYNKLEAALSNYEGELFLEEMEAAGTSGHELADAVGQENVSTLCLLAHQGGLDVEDVTHIMTTARSAMDKGMPGTASQLFPAMVATLVQLAAEVKAGAGDDGAQPAPKFAEVLQLVDALFQHSYPAGGAEALQLKRALMPDGEMMKGVEAQHQLTLSLRNLLDHVTAGKGGVKGTAHGVKLAGAMKTTLQQGVSAGMGQSLLLTPATVQALTGGVQGHKGGVNYHLAHLVLLQATAADYKCINMHEDADTLLVEPTDDKDEGLKEADMLRKLDSSLKKWCQTLGLDKDTAAYVLEVGEDLVNPQRHGEALRFLEEAGVRYTKGMSGSDDMQRAAKTLRHVSGMNTLTHSIRHEMGLYNLDPNVQQRRALDMYLIGFKGDLDTKGRLKNADSLTPQDGLLAKFISGRLKSVFTEKDKRLLVMQGTLTNEEKEQMQNRHSDFLKNVHSRRTLMKHWKEMQKVADAGRELLVVRSEYAESNAEMAGYKAERREMGIRWPHQRAERKEICKAVRNVVNFMRDKDEEHLTAEQKENLQKLLDTLKGCDPHKLLHRRGENQPPVTLATVTQIMLPKVQALEFFADDGRAHNFGDRVMGRVKMGGWHMAELKQRSHARQALGREGVRTVRAAVEAAAIKALQASGRARGDFSMVRSRNRNAVLEQMAQWDLGVEGDTNTLTSLVNVALRRITYKDGTLNLDKLCKHAESWAAHRIFRNSLKSEAPVTYVEARKQVLHNAVEAARAEGIPALVEGLEMGDVIMYEKGRGVVLDSGARFTPAGDAFVRRGTYFPASLQIQAMRNRSLGVVRTPTGYRVMVKDKDFASAVLSGRLGFGRVGLSGTVGASGEKTEGVALEFSDRARLETFLHDFMDGDSQLHKKDAAGEEARAKAAHPSWLDADQVLFLDGSGGSVSISAGLNVSLFTHFLGEQKQHALKGSFTASASQKTSFSSDVERNALGETVTVSSTIMASLAVGFAGSLVNAGVGNSSVGATTTGKALNPTSVHTYDITERIKVSTDGAGLSNKTCLEYEYGAEGLRHGAYLDYLPKDMRERLESNMERMDKLKEAGAKATPLTRVTVHWELTPEVLHEARMLMVQAKHSPPSQGEDFLRQAHALLATRTSYTPTRITIQSTQKHQIGHNYSPGLGFIKLARTNYLLMLHSEVINLKNLPEVRPAEVHHQDDME